MLIAAVAAAVLCSIPGSAVASGNPIDTAPDSQVSGWVTSSYTPQKYGGDSASSQDLYGLVAAGANGEAVNQLIGSVETAAEEGAAEPACAATVLSCAAAVVVIGGTEAAYKWGPNWFNWKSLFGGGNAGGTGLVCGVVTSTGSNCNTMPVTAGSRVCIGFDSSGRAVSWTAPSNGLLLYTGNQAYQNRSFAGGCSTGDNPVALENTSANSSKIADANAQARVTATDTGLQGPTGHDLLIWFDSTGTKSPSSAFSLADVQAYTGTNQPTTGAPSGYSTPNASTVANDLRAIAESSGNTATLYVLNCLVTDNCASTSVDTTFAMPDCYTLTPDACLNKMNWLGFTGTLQTSIAADADYTQPAGVVLSTVPTVGAGVSTLAATIADATTNPRGCEWDVQNPHESIGSPGLIDVKATDTCTYQTTVTGNLTLWKCDDPPSPDLARLAAGAWGCVETPGTVVNDSRVTAPNVATVFQVPPPDSGIAITGDGKYFIAYGSVDIGQPSSEFSNVVGPLN